jgi:hypothetical protein
MKPPIWRAGFEIEVILGDLGKRRYAKKVAREGGMDQASHTYCRAVAKRLRKLTGREWSAPAGDVETPGFYVISEYGLDPLFWPPGRLAGVELLTPPLPLAEAEVVRSEIIDAIDEIDGYFNFIPSTTMEDCAWHINIDAGEDVDLSSENYILGVDELLLLARNDRLFSRYTGLQRHAAGIPMLRHLSRDKAGKILYSSSLSNLLLESAGCSKAYAANFAKLERGYLELRHFSTVSFFDDTSLVDHLERIPAALEINFAHGDSLRAAFVAKFALLSAWLERLRSRIDWFAEPSMVASHGDVTFDGERIGHLFFNGSGDINLVDAKDRSIAYIRSVGFCDIAEGVALIALDLAELRNAGTPRKPSCSKAFQRQVNRLAQVLRSDPSLSSEYQLAMLTEAAEERRKRFEAYDL